MVRQTHSNSSSDQSSFKRALGLLSGDGLKGAEMLIERELERNPESWEAIAARADLYYFKGEYDDALKFCDISLRINSKNAFTWNTRGNVLYKMGRYDDAIECYDRAIESEPLFVRAWYNKKLALEVQLQKATKNLRLVRSRRCRDGDFKREGDGAHRTGDKRPK
jgi:tetratricopeptide (TPR) repeat protein